MQEIFDEKELEICVEQALLQGLDFVASHRIYSAWTNQNTGWQEQWEHSKFSGLYATTNALVLLSNYPERYGQIICDACQEMQFMFNTAIDYNSNATDTKEEKTRKERCRFLLAQNCNTTLKAVYFLRAYNILLQKGIILASDESFLPFIKERYLQIKDTYSEQTGLFSPAKNNATEESILTTMQAYVLMEKYGEGCLQLSTTRKKFGEWLVAYRDHHNNRTISKFERYVLKRNVIAAIYAFSNTLDNLTEDEQVLLIDVFYITMSDSEIRNGIMLKDSYMVPETMYARDTYAADSKLLYLDSILKLLAHKILPDSALEFFLDDIIEIIETVKSKNRYISWDLSPSFSHNIKGLLVLNSLLTFLRGSSLTFTATEVTPLTYGHEYSYVDPNSVVVFMPFTKDYTASFYYSIQEILSYIGLNVWCAANDPFDTLVVENIWDKLSHAQFVIIDCSNRGANVMYESGMSHGLGKNVLLCGQMKESFPYEDDSLFDTCCFNPNGNENPPPYRDLQRGIIAFIRKNVDDFCFSDAKKKELDRLMARFEDEYLN